MNTENTKQARKAKEQEAREKQESILIELGSKILGDEIQDVADEAGVVRNTAVTYLNGEAPKRKTAEKIIRAAKKIINKRIQSEAA